MHVQPAARRTQQAPLFSSQRQLISARRLKPCVIGYPLKNGADRLHLHAATSTTVQSPGDDTSPVARVIEAIAECGTVLRQGSRRFVPMIVLFFSMAFINTLLDNLKDTLIFTQAVGGGAHVIPWLQVYGVLPCSIIFLSVFNKMAAAFSRRKMFNIIISFFMGFIGLFSVALFPNAQAIHPTAFSESVLLWLPSGFAGSVAVINNWSYSLFYCAAELWGDVCLSLLFWSLANEITSLKDAAVIYPLFGIGANIAQVCAGQVLKVVGAGGSVLGYVQQMQALCMLVLLFGASILLLHEIICRRIAGGAATGRDSAQDAVGAPAVGNEQHKGRLPGSSTVGLKPPITVVKLNIPPNGIVPAARAIEVQLGPLPEGSKGANGAMPKAPNPAAQTAASGGNTKKKVAMSFRQALEYCWSNASIRCLAVMGIAQGLASNTLEYAWKLHLSQFCPTPQAFTSFLGDVASYTGVVTVMMMLVAPTCFKLLGWRRTARATPNFLLYAGVPFFLLCILYQVMKGTGQYGHLMQPMLLSLAVLGAALYVLTRSAKFSLFKPAEELIYIGLDEKARTSGKAAVDVLGAQLGKSTGALMQQVLLVFTAASALHSLPVMGLIFMVVSTSWGSSVDQLSLLVKPHTSLESCASQSGDELADTVPPDAEDESTGNGSGGSAAGRFPAIASA